MSLKYIFAPGTANELVLGEDDIFRHNPRRVHTGIAKNRATITENRDLDSYAQRQDRLNIEIGGNVQWAGYLVGLSHNIGDGRTALSAQGIAKRLKETRPDYDSLGGSLTYTSISLEDALRDYWARTPFSNYSVTPQSTELVAEDTTLQSADTDSEWGNITTIADTTPLAISGGELQLLQSCFTTEGENYDSRSGTSTISDTNYSNGNAEAFPGGSGASTTYSFTLDYDIPAGDVAFQARRETVSESTAIDVAIDGNNIGEILPGLAGQLTWTTVPTSISLSAGSHTITLTENGSGSNPLYIDVITPYDDRFSYTFDNTVSTDGYLDGPELYPDAVVIEFQEEQASFNISEATINSTWNDVSNNQEIAVSNDGGANYLTASNTSSTTQTFNTAGRTGQVRFTFSRYGSRTTATPQTGFNGQAVDVYELLVDGNDLVVIDELELSRNHFENLQQLHSYGGNWNWTIEHDDSDIADMTVVSYQQGDETRSKPSAFEDPISESAEVQAEAYFNSIYLQGALDSSGNRPTAEADDQDAINNDGREISPGVLRDPKITTEAGAVFRARALLETALSNNELVGTKTLPSDTLINPGYQYPVDFGNGDVDKTLEEVSLSESPDDVNIRARFSTPRSDLSAQIEDLQRKSRDIGDNV